MAFQQLKRSIEGKVLSEKSNLDYYSVDSSFYRLKPAAVVVPKTIQDIIKTVRYARKHRISVTVRGGGTGLVGSALNTGIILDLQYFDKIRVSRNYVEVGAGVHKGVLDSVLEKQKKFLGPNPSVGPYCTLGGMIGTNASGSRSLKYGSIIDSLIEVTLVTANGRLLKLPSKSRLALSTIRLAKLVDRKQYPQTSKNSCGYRLDAIHELADTPKIIAASEGTLGIVVSAKLHIHDVPKNRCLVILGYSSASAAARDCMRIVQIKPSALEFVDHNTMKNIRAKIPPRTRCLLFVEFDSDIAKSTAMLNSVTSGKILYKLKDEKSILQWWSYRNSALYFSLKNILSESVLPHIIEDAAVPLDKLDSLMKFADDIRRRFGVKLVMYGHAGNGNMHIRMASKNKSKTLVNRIALEFFSKVISVNGTTSGEHGDGIARSKYVKLQYGKKNYSLFTKLKAEFDPMNTLNPNKILV